MTAAMPHERTYSNDKPADHWRHAALTETNQMIDPHVERAAGLSQMNEYLSTAEKIEPERPKP